VTLFADVVRASMDVASTSSRTAKIATLAGLLKRLEADEIGIVVGFLSGAPRQGRVGIGWSTVHDLGCETVDEPSIEVSEVDEAIAIVRATTGPGSVTKRKQVLTDLLSRATPDEAGFIRRLFTGELRQGALAGLMVDAVAKAAGVGADITRRALMFSGDLPKTATIALTEGDAGLRSIGFEIFRPVLPMLASAAENMTIALGESDEASVEWKLDGIRVQVHRRGDEVRIYTRNLNDITDGLPAIVEQIRALDVERAVFDGEALGFFDDETPLSFQDTVAKGSAPRAFLFDVLHHDGVDLMDEPLRVRRDVLRSVAKDLCIPGVVTNDPDEAQLVLDEALAAGHEGVVVKDTASAYVAGRRGKAWRKVKPHRTFDLVVLAAEWGHGRRRGWLSNLHLGAREPTTGAFLMVGKCFKGLTDELLEYQTKQLLARETHREGITVFVRPELVVEIALDGVQRSPRYPGGIAMRFARVRRYRPDKLPEDADAIDDLRALLR
jgi:DNA ligase-1